MTPHPVGRLAAVTVRDSHAVPCAKCGMPRPRPSQASFQARKLPRQRRSRVTVEALVEATARVLAEGGYRGATTRRIAERLVRQGFDFAAFDGRAHGESGGAACTLTHDDFWADDLWQRSVIAACNPALFAQWRDWIRAHA